MRKGKGGRGREGRTKHKFKGDRGKKGSNRRCGTVSDRPRGGSAPKEKKKHKRRNKRGERAFVKAGNPYFFWEENNL